MSLDRFVAAQQNVYPTALAELRAGAKRSHWMWFVFPQIAGLGRSETARRYAIRDLAEARAYLLHPLLGARLIEATEAMLDHAGAISVDRVLGPVDALKLGSSMTLFEAAAIDPDQARPFARCLDAFFSGRRDQATLDRL
ncbi:DUF1810 domain-containing protein [Hephaestia mangrovi]|uniref:DUF1810 domain-containing protein n=1 Tax=Hephaestia mangrovi TaxID=2873268 RepID=UPI001CA70EF3|nr:DUF1810 domain-containing protein [Hephaestia mangrovi]